MSNGEIQPEKELQLRRSKFRKSISRTLSTAKFEGIVITEEIEEEIEWKTLPEWQKKHDNWTIMLINRFKQSHDEILKELNLEDKKAFFRNYLEEKDNRPDPHEPNPLDDLDTLN